MRETLPRQKRQLSAHKRSAHSELSTSSGGALPFVKAPVALLLALLCCAAMSFFNPATAAPKDMAEPTNTAKKNHHPLAQAQKLPDNLAAKLKTLDNLYVPIHWSDPATGLAIGGFDPMTYFEHQKFSPGKEEHEYVWRNVSWRFVSKGNLQMFKRSPSLFAPVYAGYDAYALSKGILTAGRPSIWQIFNGRLYLFHSPVNRYLWQEYRIKLQAKVQQNWQTLSLDLPRYKIKK